MPLSRSHRRAAGAAALALLPSAVAAPLAAPLGAQAAATAPTGATRGPLPAADAALTARLDSVARAWMDGGQSPGLSVAVVRGRDTLLVRGYGEADRATHAPVTPATAFRLGSVTKQFTAALVMQLVERGTVQLDDPIGKHLAELPEAWRAATVRQLLDHTSGIPSYTALGPSWMARWREDMTPRTVALLTADRPMDFAPGTAWRYDNTGYVLLGMLAERHFGRPYAQLVAERFARPLGLATLAYCPPTLPAPGQATGYGRTPGGFVDAPVISMTQPYAAGALCATAIDVARWNAALAGGRVVSAESYRAMTTPTGPAAANSYGLGLAATTRDGVRAIVHGGAIHGFMSENAWFPDASLSVTVLANAGGARLEPLLNALMRTALGVQVPALVLDSAARAPYVGTYAVTMPNGAVWNTRIRETGRGLVAGADAPGQGEFPLVARSAHVFGSPMDPTLRFRFTVVDGRATRLDVEQRGMTFGGARVEAGSR